MSCDFPIPDSAKHLEFAKNIFFYPKAFEFNYDEASLLLEDKNNIPRILHLIWVGDREPPSYVLENVQKWSELMPNWKMTFWTNNDINSQHFSNEVIELIYNSEKGAQKADIMRYHIIEKYGGVYLDSDITPHRSLEPLIKQLPDTNVIFCHDLDLSWPYISIGFFAAVPNNPVIKKACDLCHSFEINKEPLYMFTGPRLLGEAVATANSQAILLPSKYFYHNDSYEGRFGHHWYAMEWK